jgi:hypothetical protein
MQYSLATLIPVTVLFGGGARRNKNFTLNAGKNWMAMAHRLYSTQTLIVSTSNRL